MTDLASYRLEGKTAVIGMDDGKANALSNEMITALGAALDRAEAEANAVVLTGREGRFCAGFDLRIMMSSPDAAKALLTRGAELFMRLYGLGLPVVAACSGHALAGGAIVLMTADYRFCADGAFKIGLNEVQIGLPVPILAMDLAKARLSPTELTRATLLAHVYDPDEALNAGYVDMVVPAADLLSRALAEADRLGQLSRVAIKATKLRLRGATIDRIRATLSEDMDDLLGAAGR